MHTPLFLCLALLTVSAAPPGSGSQGGGDSMLSLTDGRVFVGLDMEHAEDGVLVHFDNGDVTVPARLVRDVIIGGIEEAVAETEDEKKKQEKGYVRFEGEWMQPGRRDKIVEERLDARRAEIEEMTEHGEWANHLEDETRHFQFKYTIPRFVFEGYRDRMEAYFDIFAKDWRVKQPRDKGKLTVNFYGSRKEFNRTSGAKGGTLAYFMFLGDYDLNVFFDRLDPERTETIMYHEANHYLQKLIDTRFSYPHWPGEALAEYYGGSLWDPKKKKLSVGLVQEGRLVEIRSDIAQGERLGIRDLILEDRYEDYTWGWSLVHFLMNDKRYESKFKKFFVGLTSDSDIRRVDSSFALRTVEGPDMLEAFKSYLGLRTDEDLAELEKEWHEYIEETLEIKGTKGMESAALAAKSGGRKIRAKRLFEECIAAGTPSPNVYHHYAQLLWSQKEKDAAIEAWREAIALDPLIGAYHHALGTALARNGKEEEGEREQALALELDPQADSSGWSGL